MTVDTKANLLARANQVRTETAGFANTASRLGGLFRDIVDSLFGSVGRYSVVAQGADPAGGNDPSAAFAAAAALAASTGGTVYVPKGTYGTGANWSFALPSGVTLEGDGDGSTLVNCYITVTGTAGAEIPFTGDAAKGATSIPIPGTGLTGSWIRLASVINAMSPDAGAEQLGHVVSDYLSFAEFAEVVGESGSSVTLYQPILFPYSNTPGGDSRPGQTTSVARVINWNSGGVIRRIRMLGKNSAFNSNIQATFARHFRIEDCTLDCNNITSQIVRYDFCADCQLVGSTLIGKRTSVPTGSTANPVLIASSSRVVVDGCTIEHGRQGIDVSYTIGGSSLGTTYRGGPSIECGAVNCYAFDQDLDGYTSHWGCVGSFFVGCHAMGAPRGVRVRDRGALVSGCHLMSGYTASGVGILVDNTGIIDCRVIGNYVLGYQEGIMFAHEASGIEALEALLGYGSALVSDNNVRNCADHGIWIQQAYTSAVLVGPRISNNEVHACGTDAILVGPYNNGTVITGNRVSGVPANRGGIRYDANITHLCISENYVFTVDAAGNAVRGSGISAHITDTTTFPAGEAAAFLDIGVVHTNASTPFGSILRNAAGFAVPAVPGWQTLISNIGETNPSLTRSMFTAWIDATVGHLRMRTLNGANTVDRQYSVAIRGSGDPNGVVTASVGELYVRTNGGAGSTLYVKESGTNTNTGWVAK